MLPSEKHKHQSRSQDVQLKKKGNFIPGYHRRNTQGVRMPLPEKGKSNSDETANHSRYWDECGMFPQLSEEWQFPYDKHKHKFRSQHDQL
mmetsp:Transcript_57909/g.101450  ORF Transcript_57909/g.101450 Transcript_57909/m.101450 type:complete len:90 (-) Transcript_57909:210-479(-)